MPNLDGGHYFLTALIPVNNTGLVAHGETRSSPIHMVREALETLPTALQSHATEATGIQSPFARSLRTHFARLVVLDQPFYNGRDTANSIVSAARGTNLLTAQPVDALACPYIVFAVDFDPEANGGEEPRSYLEELWQLAQPELTAVFKYCFRFDEIMDAAGFAHFIMACQVETTMPFNDYWTVPPPLPAISPKQLAIAPAVAVLVAVIIAFAVPLAWWLGILLGLLLLIAALVFDYAWITRFAARPFPAAPNSTLPHVLKALYLQQKFTRFAIAQQGVRGPALRAAFADFVATHQPGHLAGPTQPPGVIRS